MSQPRNIVIEPGLSALKEQSHSVKAAWLKVAAIALIMAITSLLLIGSTISPHVHHDIRSNRQPGVLGNTTAQQPTSALKRPFAPQKRDDWWDQKVKKGHWLACLMNMDDEKVTPQSPWSDFAALEQNDWETEQWTLDAPGDSPFLRALRALNIRTALRIFEQTQVSITPSAWTEMDHNHPDSEADYQNLFNFGEGILVADFNYSPDYKIKTEELDVTAPALKQWSDVVFLDWQTLHRQAGSTNEQKRKIEHVLRIKIRNEETIDTVRAAKNGGVRATSEERPPAYPGWEWKIHEEAAEAILGTANGAGAAYFLVQHKAYFGIKGVESIVAFDCSESEDSEFEMCLNFRIADGPVVIRGK